MTVPHTREIALTAKPLDCFLVAGEESGDILGAGLMRAIARRSAGATFRGIGGVRMEKTGLVTLFPMDDLTAIGFGAVIGKLPTILRRFRETVQAIVANPPDILILIDAPDFTHRVARRVRRQLPDLPIVKYVAPTVWVWRPGRAKAMRGSIDHVLAVLPFEPMVMDDLDGPATSYVGHPLLAERLLLRPDAIEKARRAADPSLLLVLPGSRGQELKRLGAIFGAALGRLAAEGRSFDLVLPTLPRLEARVRALTSSWPVQPRIVVGDAERQAAFRNARAALAASGTVTLELALAGVPMVTAYRVPAWEGWIARFVIRVRSVILANLILGENVVPEFLQSDCRPDKLAAALAVLLEDGPSRRIQLDAFQRLDGILGIGDELPAERAASIVLRLAGPRADTEKGASAP